MPTISLLTTYRLLAVGCAILVPLSGLVLDPSRPREIDPMWFRLLLSGWFIVLLGVSYHHRYRESLAGLWSWTVWIASAWYLTIAGMNGFSLQYAVGGLIILPVGGSVLRLMSRNLRMLQIYYGVGAVAIGGIVISSNISGGLQTAYMASLTTVVAAMYLIQHRQIQTAEKLRASQRKYRSLFHASNDAIVIHDLDGRIVDVNPRVEELFERDAGWFHDTTVYDLHAPEAEETVRRALDNLAAGESTREEVRCERASGTAFWGILSMNPVNLGGDTVGRTMIRDVTRERRLQGRLKEERDQFSQVLHTSPVAITIVDCDGTVTFANQRAEEVLGLPRLSITGRAHDDDAWQLTALDGSELSDEEMPFTQVMKTGAPVYDEQLAIEWPDGTRRLLSVNGAPFRAEGDEISSVVFAMEDITERRATEHALTRSQRRLQALFDHALDVFLLADDEARYVDVNPAAEEILGYSREALLNMSLLDLTAEASREDVRAAWNEFLDDGEMEGEYRLETADGRTLDFEIRAVADIQPGVHLAVLRDVTDRRRLETQSDRFFSLNLDLLCIADTDGYFQRLNPAFEEVFGYDSEELLSRRFIEFVHPDDRRDTLKIMERLGEGQDVAKFVNRYRHSDGEYRWIEWHAAPDLNRDRIYAAARDVTERRKYERELRCAKEEAEEMNRLKSSFLANMSHEIRTPLTTIIGYADLLKDRLSEDDHSHVQRIAESGHRLLTTLNSVLDLAQLESGAMRVKPEAFDCAAEIRRLADTLQVQTVSKSVELRTDLPPGPMPVYLDRGILTRIVTNLVHNAIKFTDEGHVSLGCRAVDRNLLVQVTDTGVGMEESFVEDLFEAFRQESTGANRRYEGSGLGLTITKHLVELLNGRIEVESRKGAGSTFSVRLPRMAESPDDSEDSRAGLPSKSQETLPKNQRVLIVDDDPSVGEILSEMLPKPYVVRRAEEVETVFEVLENKSCDLIFMDINLKSGVDGDELRSSLETSGIAAGATIIAVTAYALPGDREKYLEAGFDGYIAKPFNRQILMDELRKVLL